MESDERADDAPIDEAPIVELAELQEPASEQLAERVQRAVDRVETAAHIGDFTGGVLKRVLLEILSLLIGLFAAQEQPRDEGSD